MTTKEIVLYTNHPYTKFRWIGLVTSIHMGFVLFNIVVMPNKKLLQEHTQALKNKKTRDEESLRKELASLETGESLANKSRNILQSIREFQYGSLFSLQNIWESFADRPYFNAGLLTAASLISYGLILFPRRQAHVITLLPKDRVRFESFTAFGLGKRPSVELPCRDISCIVGRTTQNNYSILKFKGYMWHHLVNKKDGKFLQPKLFDQHLGYQRSWHSK